MVFIKNIKKENQQKKKETFSDLKANQRFFVFVLVRDLIGKKDENDKPINPIQKWIIPKTLMSKIAEAIYATDGTEIGSGVWDLEEGYDFVIKSKTKTVDTKDGSEPFTIPDYGDSAFARKSSPAFPDKNGEYDENITKKFYDKYMGSMDELKIETTDELRTILSTYLDNIYGNTETDDVDTEEDEVETKTNKKLDKKMKSKNKAKKEVVKDEDDDEEDDDDVGGYADLLED